MGGVWNRERVYDELLTESSLGMYEYSDEPMLCDRINGKHISIYLENYARKHHLYERIRFNTRVTSFQRMSDQNQWELTFESSSKTAHCDKLIVATGLTSTPSMPNVPTSDICAISQYHVRSLAQIKLRSSDKHVIVAGGAKSAYDAAYTMVKQGAECVTLVIKDTNPGPAWLLPEHILFNINTDKLFATRLAAALTPNIWFSHTWSHYLLHQTTIGQWLVKTIWQIAEKMIKYRIGYEENDQLKTLLPDQKSLFWSSTNTCTLNHPEFVDMIIDGRIVVKRSTIVQLARTNTVHFADGATCEADLLIWAIGWKTNLTPPTLQECLNEQQHTETYVFKQCPMLRRRPLMRSKSSTRCSFALYRRLVPLDHIYEHSIVYVGMFQTPGTGVIAEVQAVWSAIYLMKDLKIQDDPKWDVLITHNWLKHRYPLVERHIHYAHDFIRYADLLLIDLDLNPMRKNNVWHRETFETYMPRDYQGLVKEWLLKKKLSD